MYSRIIEIEPYQTLLVKGQAQVIALSRGLSAISKEIPETERVSVRRGKLLPFETTQKGNVQLNLGYKSNYFIADGKVGVKIWKSLLNYILKNKSNKILILGSNDSGKSTLTAHINNNLISRQNLVGIIDEDLGQGDLAPPGCIGGKILNEQIFDLRDLKADFFGFIGDITPRKFGKLLLNEVCKLVDIIDRMSVDFCILNTDGFINNEGFFLKIELIKEINPDLIICFEEVGGKNILYEKIKREVSNSIILARRTDYSRKTLIDRTKGRMSQYRRFIGKSNLVNLNIRKLNIHFLGSTYYLNDNDSCNSCVIKIDNKGNRLVFLKDFSNYVEFIDEGLNKRSLIGIHSLINMFVGLGLRGNVMHFGKIIRIYPDLSADISTSSRIIVDTLFLSFIKIPTYSNREYRLPIIVNSV